MNKKQMTEWFRLYFHSNDELTIGVQQMACRLAKELRERVDLGYGHPSNWPGEVHLWMGSSHMVIRRCYEEVMIDPYGEHPYFRLSCGRSRLESPHLAALENEIIRLYRKDLITNAFTGGIHV